MEQTNFENLLRGQKLIPVVTIGANDDPVRLANYLLEREIRCIEITLRTPESMKAVKLIKNELGDKMIVGVGTVLNSTQVQTVTEIGVDFIVCPGISPRLIDSLTKSAVPFLPGVATPSEIMVAAEMGLHWLKFFPANINGGAKALKAYAQVFNQIKFCPTGGVSPDNKEEYLNLPNVFAVGGSWLQKGYK